MDTKTQTTVKAQFYIWCEDNNIDMTTDIVSAFFAGAVVREKIDNLVVDDTKFSRINNIHGTG